MKKLISGRHIVRASLVLTGLVIATAAQTLRAATVDGEIRAVMEAQVAAWNRGDIDGFMEGYARSNATEFVSGYKLTRGWLTVRNRYRMKYTAA